MPLSPKRILGGVLGLALLGGLVFWGVQATRPAPVRYVTEPASRGDLEAKVAATGTLSALVTVQVGSQVSGRVSELFADFNTPVKKGQLLARLEPQLFEADLARAQATAVSARSTLTKARIDAEQSARQLERARQLWGRQLIARADLDTAQATADAARAQVAAANAGVAQADAAIHQAQLNLGYATIRSPIDGTVISRAVDVGQTVAASLQAPVLFTIAQDLRHEQVEAAVSEADVGKLKPGMSATFTVSAFPNDKFRGVVRQVRNAATTQQNVVTYTAIIDVDNPELKLKPGMTANISFVYEKRENALRIPNAALRFAPPDGALSRRTRAPRAGASAGAGEANGNAPRRGEGEAGAGAPRQGDGEAGPGAGRRAPADPTKRRVWILQGDQPRPVPVTIGLSDGTYTEVTDGRLQEGDAVITETESGASSGGRRTGAGGGNRPPRGMF